MRSPDSEFRNNRRRANHESEPLPDATASPTSGRCARRRVGLGRDAGRVHPSTPATAEQGTSDVVRVWNANALAALTNPPTAATPGAGQGATVTGLNMAMVQLAVFDAVNSIVGGHAPYLSGLPEVSEEGSVDAAVATAAHDVLIGLGRAPVPALPEPVRGWLAVGYAETLAAIPDGPAKDAGIDAGAAAAAAMLASRDGDGRFVADPFTEGSGPGAWRPTSGVNDPAAWVRNVRPFTLDSSLQFLSEGPRQLDSGAYAREYNEVKALGSKTASRTPDQQALADFYQPNPVELFNRAFRGLTAGQGLSVAEEARFYAMVNVSATDAAIHCWAEKETWSFWRPITAIRGGDSDGNHGTVGDPTWEPFITTPPYPEHLSGYNCNTAALMHAGQRFFHDPTMDFSVTNRATGVTRQYHRFRDVYADTIEARILQGIHFRSADVQGARLGKQVANWVADNLLQPEQ